MPNLIISIPNHIPDDHSDDNPIGVLDLGDKIPASIVNKPFTVTGLTVDGDRLLVAVQVQD